PQLMEQFETAFGIPLTEETIVSSHFPVILDSAASGLTLHFPQLQSIKDTLSQIDTQLFEAYTEPHAASLAATVSAGILAPNWEPIGRALNVRPYVHDALLNIVMVHAQVVTTASSLTHRIISFLLECLSADLL